MANKLQESVSLRRARVVRGRPFVAVSILVCLAVFALAAVSVWAGATRNPSSLNFETAVYERVSVDVAQARLPFHLLQPTVMPPAYTLESAEIPRNRPDHLRLVYKSREHPTRDLVITEGAASTQPGLEDLAKDRARIEQITLNGEPALLIRGIVSQKQGDSSSALDENGNELAFKHSGVLVRLFGWRDSGVDRAMLLQTAASMK